MPKLKIKTPNIHSSTLTCHAEAMSAFMIAKEYKYQYEGLNLSKKTIQLLQTFDPIHAIEVSINNYQFFSGWFWLANFRHINCEKITVIVHSEIEQYDIQKVAWTYLFSNQIKSFHRHNNLIQLSHYLDSIPDHIKKDLFSSISTSSSQIMVQQLSNESRSAVRNQKKHFKLLESLIDKPSIREQLTGGNKNVT